MMKECGCSKSVACGCCEGVEVLTPEPTANRPGLSALNYRIGTHSTFFESMTARLSGFHFEAAEPPGGKRPLAGLKTRLTNDASIALLSGAATVLDVLTFYQERIANEGFLRTATERRSVLELGRLVGYTPRPGVAASVYLAYTLDDNSDPVEIPLGARAQSVPMQDELPQSFETGEKLEARPEWNDLKRRTSKPKRITYDNVLTIETIYFKGTETKLKANDPLLFVFDAGGGQKQEKFTLRRAQTVTPDYDENITAVILRALPATSLVLLPLLKTTVDLLEKIPSSGIVERAQAAAKTVTQNIRLGSYPRSTLSKDGKTILRSKDLEILVQTLNRVIAEHKDQVPDGLKTIASTLNKLLDKSVVPDIKSVPPTDISKLLNSLLAAPSLQPANSLRLPHSIKNAFSRNSDIHNRLMVNFQPGLTGKLYPALAAAPVSVAIPELKAVYALRLTAPLFGYNAPKIYPRPKNEKDDPVPVEPDINGELENQLILDSAYDKITASDNNTTGYAVFDRSDAGTTEAFQIADAKIGPRTEYGISSKATALTFNEETWAFSDNSAKFATFSTIRQATVYTQNEPLELAETPLIDLIEGTQIELAELYDGLEAGRWIIVSGERADVQDVGGIKASELVMLAGVEQTYDKDLPGDKIHTFLTLAENGLAYKYKRKTVKIYGNVVKATHGETRSEVLGSGDATRSLQTFELKQPPLTFVSAPTTSGIESTLVVRVNDVKWKEAGTLAELSPKDRSFVTRIDDDAKTSVIFGNGEYGARLPSGIENVTAVYRNGIGKPGNVEAEQISLLMTKPLGVREVINPLPASGGADKETRDQARSNVPVALMALDRLVSTKDYADFARTFAGIGKSRASRLSDGYRQVVHLTIAGAEDIPIDKNSDVYNNLRRALSKYGDPFQPVQIAVRELLALVISARVSIHPDYLWESVAPKIRAALLDAFSFERRVLGQSVFLGEVLGIIQNVEGVVYSDVDVLDSISETELANETHLKRKTDGWAILSKPKPFVRAEFARRTDPKQSEILPAQLAYLTPEVPDTLILNQIDEVKK